MLSKLGRGTDATRITRLADKAIDAVNQKLWSEEDGVYMDIQTIWSDDNSDDSSGNDKTYRLLTQDVTYYLTAATASTVNDSFEDITLFPLYLDRLKQMVYKEP